MRYSEKQYLDWAEDLYAAADDTNDDAFVQSRATLGLLAVELAREARRLIEEE